MADIVAYPVASGSADITVWGISGAAAAPSGGGGPSISYRGRSAAQQIQFDAVRAIRSQWLQKRAKRDEQRTQALDLARITNESRRKM